MKSLFRPSQKNLCALFALLMAGAITLQAFNPSAKMDKFIASSTEKTMTISSATEEDKDQDSFTKMVRMSLVPALSLAAVKQILKK
ncbi:hypothetical protein [Peijinzhouia sedimentorum]